MREHPTLKSPLEIEKLRDANRVVAAALKLVKEMVRPGTSTGEIDAAVEQLIFKSGAEPLFKGYPASSSGVPPFPASICASIDEEVVHGIPSPHRILREGQILSVDVGAKLNGYCGDSAWSFPVGEVSKKSQKLLAVGEECLLRAIGAIRPNGTLKDVAQAVQTIAEKNGFSVVRQFVGHGIGREMHEAPQVPNYVGKANLDLLSFPLQPGLVIAIEPMVNAGSSQVITRSDGWTVVTRDGGKSVHFEHSVAVTSNGVVILSDGN